MEVDVPNSPGTTQSTALGNELNLDMVMAFVGAWDGRDQRSRRSAVSISPKDKKEALADLNEALKSPAPPIENKGNIDLVAKYYDKLADALGGDQQ